MALLKSLWVEKYRPNTLDDYIFQNPGHRVAIDKLIKDQSIPHLLFSGVQGTGKTTLARILINNVGVDENDVLVINASDERGIDVFRDKVKSFSSTVAAGTFKIIHLEEADKLTPDAQTALKAFMEDMSEYVRFIFTCNHVNKIIAPIRSRCQEYNFKAAPFEDIAEYLVKVLAKEKVKFNLDLLDKYVTAGYPDVRNILNSIEKNVVDGVLQVPTAEGNSGDYKLQLLDMLNEKNWIGARELACSTIPSDEYADLYAFLYENIHKVELFKKQAQWDQAIVIMAEHDKNNTLVSSAELNAAAMFIKLSMIK